MRIGKKVLDKILLILRYYAAFKVRNFESPFYNIITFFPKNYHLP